MERVDGVDAPPEPVVARPAVTLREVVAEAMRLDAMERAGMKPKAIHAAPWDELRDALREPWLSAADTAIDTIAEWQG